MASKAHQLILGVIARKMREKEYEIISFDGNESLIGDISLNIPPTIKRHRPDITGIHLKDKRICIGEAKTDFDLVSKRTKEQFVDYATLLTKSGKSCELIIGIPRFSEKKLRKILRHLNLLDKLNVSYIWVPDEFLIDENEI